MRCRHRRRRGHTVPDHVVRLSCAGSERAGPCRPFDAARDGISIGEAAGFALLEKPQADDGGDAIMLLGVGESNDAHHMSSPHPEGIGARLAMERALTRGGPGASPTSTTSTCTARRPA